MSIVARVFVVLTFIVSIVFLIFALQIWTARTKWQKLYELERQQNIERKAEIQKRIIDLSQDVVMKEEVIKFHKQRNRDLFGKVKDKGDEVLKLQGELAEAKASVSMHQATTEELIRENGRRAEELVKLKGVLLKQQQAVQVARDNEVKARNERAEMENELNATKQTLAAIQRDKRTIEEDLATQTRRIETLISKNVPIWDLIGEDPKSTQNYVADALVLAVRPDLNLVMISVGSAQGVKPGYQFVISRGSTYVATAQVERVYPDMCSAKLVLKKDEVQIHDEAKSGVSSGKQ